MVYFSFTTASSEKVLSIVSKITQKNTNIDLGSPVIY